MIRMIADAAFKATMYIGYIALFYAALIGFLYLIPIMLSIFV